MNETVQLRYVRWCLRWTRQGTYIVAGSVRQVANVVTAAVARATDHQLGPTAARRSSRAATTRSTVCTRIVRLASRANASLLNPACARTISASAMAVRSVARVMASRTAWYRSSAVNGLSSTRTGVSDD